MRYENTTDVRHFSDDQNINDGARDIYVNRVCFDDSFFLFNHLDGRVFFNHKKSCLQMLLPCLLFVIKETGLDRASTGSIPIRIISKVEYNLTLVTSLIDAQH